MRMTGFHLRAIKCPGCGAQVPYDGGATEVRCEYCQQISAVVRGTPPKTPGPRAPQRPAPALYPQVTPAVRPVAILFFVGVLMAVGTGAGLFLLGPGPQAVPAVATLAAPSTEPQRAYVYDSEPAAPEEGVNEPAEVEPEPDGGTGKRPVAPKPKPKPKPKPRKPDGYKIARILKPALAGCAPRDLFQPGHPVWYTPTITTTVGGDSFHKTSVSVEATKAELSKIYFADDRARPVTQAHIDERESRVAACVKKGVDAITIPADSPQRGVAGTVRITFTRDGVPYGVKNL